MADRTAATPSSPRRGEVPKPMAGSSVPSWSVYVGIAMRLNLPSTRSELVGRRLVAGQAVGAPVLLHLGLVEVALALDQLVAGELLELLEDGVVGVVVALDDLEGPATRQHIAAHQLAVDALGQLVVPGVAELLHGVAEREVGGAGEAVEGVEVAARDLDGLEGLRQLAQRRDGRVVDAVRALVRGVRAAHPPRTSATETAPCSASIASARRVVCSSVTSTPASAKPSRSSRSTVPSGA